MHGGGQSGSTTPTMRDGTTARADGSSATVQGRFAKLHVPGALDQGLCAIAQADFCRDQDVGTTGQGGSAGAAGALSFVAGTLSFAAGARSLIAGIVCSINGICSLSCGRCPFVAVFNPFADGTASFAPGPLQTHRTHLDGRRPMAVP